MRTLKALRLVALLVTGTAAFTSASFAAADRQLSGSVISVNRPIRMSRAENLPPKDFYIDLGAKHGVRPGSVLEVFRELPVLNGLTGGAISTLRVTLGELKVLAVGASMSVARMAVERAPAELPAMETGSVQIGDEVQLKTDLPTVSATF